MGDKVVVPAAITPHPGKAMGEDAAFEVFEKRLAHKGAQCVMVALTVALAGAGQLKLVACHRICTVFAQYLQHALHPAHPALAFGLKES